MKISVITYDDQVFLLNFYQKRKKSFLSELNHNLVHFCIVDHRLTCGLDTMSSVDHVAWIPCQVLTTIHLKSFKLLESGRNVYLTM